MTAFDYAEAIADARELLAEFGQIGSIHRTTSAGGGATDPTGGTSTATPYPATMCVLPVSQRDVDGTTIRTGDWRVIIEALDIEITTADRIVCSEGTLTIIDPGKLAPAGIVVMYDAKARG
jgi:hypothetical protein